MDGDRKKELREAYKNKPVVGGVCGIRCSGNGRLYLQATRNVEGLKNRFNFAMSTKTSPDPSLLGEWKEYGSESFSFVVLEELEKGENQTAKEFAEDIDALYEMWLEKNSQGEV